jgi:GxxExxY protein
LAATLIRIGISQKIIGAAQEVHREFEPGFLENVYEGALAKELAALSVTFVRQTPLEVAYKDDVVGLYYADLLVEGRVICELKAVKAIAIEHEAQLLHYLKATGLQVRLILNFGSSSLQVKRKIQTPGRDNPRLNPSNPR